MLYYCAMSDSGYSREGAGFEHLPHLSAFRDPTDIPQALEGTPFAGAVQSIPAPNIIRKRWLESDHRHYSIDSASILAWSVIHLENALETAEATISTGTSAEQRSALRAAHHMDIRRFRIFQDLHDSVSADLVASRQTPGPGLSITEAVTLALNKPTDFGQSFLDPEIPLSLDEKVELILLRQELGNLFLEDNAKERHFVAERTRSIPIKKALPFPHMRRLLGFLFFTPPSSKQ
jgi:hypothetical protein